MSSLGGAWRALWGAAAAEVRDGLIKKLEQAAAIRWSEGTKEVEVNKERPVTGGGGRRSAAEPADGSQPAGSREEGTPEQAGAPGAGQPAGAPGAGQPAGALGVGSSARELTVEGILHGLKLSKDLHLGKISAPGWKHNKPHVTKRSVHARTAHVVAALARADSVACVAKRAEDFVHHVTQYPEARDLAIKEGAVRALLRVQDRLRADGERHAAGLVNEALALAGYSAPPAAEGPNVLALDGGGIRGLIAIEVLRHLERLTGRKVNQLFDYIIGVSTGAIIAAVIGGGVGDLETASKLYHTLSKEMFGNTSIIGGTSRLVWSHSYYDTAVWEKMLQDNLGDCMLTHCNRTPNPKMALVSCVVKGSRLSPFLFRTYSCGYRVRGALRGTTRARVWHAVRASAAAPTYFQEFHRDGLVHQDGGLMLNNPAGVGVHEARLVWGSAAMARGTLVSLGTGQAAPTPTPTPTPAAAAGTSWRDKFNTILESATDTEGVHLLLNELLPPGSYFRFNPPLTAPCAMDEVDPRRVQDMLTDAQAYIRRNQHKFELCARRLTRPRTALQRLGDAAKRRAILAGLTH